MAAPLGFKTFATGDVLSAADTNGYLMQGVWTFASAAARTTAVTSPQQGNVSYLKDTNSLEIYSGSAWVAYGSGDITGVTAGTGLSGGATSGNATLAIDTTVTVDKTTAQTLTNKTLTSPALTTPTISTATTNGDLLYGTGSGALTRLGIGSSGQVLTVASGAPTWATPAGGGGMTLINTGGTAVSGLTTVTISSIPATYKYLKILCIGIKRGSVGGAVLGLQLNGDTSAQYLYGQTKFSNTTAGSTSSTSTTSYEICAEVASSNGGAGEALLANIDIYGYANTSYSKLIVSQATAHQNNWINQNGNGFYTVATAITSISIISSQTMGDGTVYVYGVS